MNVLESFRKLPPRAQVLTALGVAVSLLVCAALLVGVGFVLGQASVHTAAILTTPAPLITIVPPSISPVPSPAVAPPYRVAVVRNKYISPTLTVTLAVTFTAQGNPLYGTPLLVVGGESAPPEPNSLQQARLALVGVVADGSGRISLRFRVPTWNGQGRLSLNPSQDIHHPLFPRVEVEIVEQEEQRKHSY